MGLLLVIPALLITLLWFRKGWVVQWCWIVAVMFTFSSCGVDGKHPEWWYSEDYMGELWYEKGDYEKAAEHFRDPEHKAAAYFKAGDYQSAAELLSNDTTAAGKYNYGLALAKLGLYDDAVEAFKEVGNQNPSLREKANKNIQVVTEMKSQSADVLRFHPHTSAIDKILKNTEKDKLKERKPEAEDEQLTSDTEVKKLPTTGDRMSDEVASNIHRAKEQEFPPKDFKMEEQTSIETKVLMQKTNADPGEFLHRRFEIQRRKYYPDVKQGKETW